MNVSLPHTALRRNRQRHADGVSAAQHQRHRGQAHPRYQLRDGQPCLDVAAHRVQKQQQAVHVVRLLQRRQQRQDVLIFGAFRVVGQHHMPLHLSHDGQAVYRAVAVLHHGGAHVHQLLHRRGGLLLRLAAVRRLLGFLCLICHAPRLLFRDRMCGAARFYKQKSRLSAAFLLRSFSPGRPAAPADSRRRHRFCSTRSG